MQGGSVRAVTGVQAKTFFDTPRVRQVGSTQKPSREKDAIPIAFELVKWFVSVG